MILAERSALNVTLLRAVRGPLESGPVEVTVGGEVHELRVTDVGGLVDLNTAQPPLLDAYLGAIGLTELEIARFRTWRQTSKRLLRIEDLLRVSEAVEADWALLMATATVYSGRPGVSLEDAPEAVRKVLEPVWQEVWASPASSVNFRVERVTGAGMLPVGVVHIRPDGEGKVLWAGF